MRSVSISALAFCVAMAFVMTQPAESQQVYDGFSVTFPDLYSGSGTGFGGNWQRGAAPGSLSENSLTYAGLVTSGGSVSAPADFVYHTRRFAQSLGANNTTVYLSFLLQPQAELNEPTYFGLILNSTSGLTSGLFIGKPGGNRTDEDVIETWGGFGQVSSGVPVAVGQPVLLVVKAEFFPGNDRFTLYANPTPGDPEPSSGAVKTDLDIGVAPELIIYGIGTPFAIDEIRIGATYANVVPVAPPVAATSTKPAPRSAKR